MKIEEIEFEGSNKPTLNQVNCLRKLLTNNQLNTYYDVASAKLENINCLAIEKTRSELFFRSLLKKHTKLTVYTSFWIGRRCVDFFLPAIGHENVVIRQSEDLSIKKSSKGMKGLIIEIDGDIHNRGFKMTKDNNRDDDFLGLEIGVFHIENQDIFSNEIHHIIQKISSMPRLAHRTKIAQLNRIKAFTILSILQNKWE